MATDKVEHNDHVVLIWLTGGILALIGVQFFQNRYAHANRGGAHHRIVGDAAVTRAAMDPDLGFVTPSERLHYGSGYDGLGHVAHKVTYPPTPGYNLDRLINGAPGASLVCPDQSLRGWLVEPPAEVDY